MAILDVSKKGKNAHVLGFARGQIGGMLVIKQYKNRTVLANFPAKIRTKPTTQQKKGRSLFKSAVKYAKAVNKNVELKASYNRKLKGHRNVFQAALADYMNNPEVRKVK